MNNKTEKRVTLIKEGWFHIPESANDRPYLIGSKCEECGLTTFPKAAICPNCMKDDTMSEIHLSTRGKLESFTVSMQGPPGFTTPYIQAFVVLPEKVRLFTLIEGCQPEPDALQIGQEMELVIGKIKFDEHGNDIIGWKFKPVDQH
ncbi:MAG: OB-fold domain-containing protein [Chloroflexota bacterium]